MDLEMHAKIKFNKPMNPDELSVSLGGYVMVMGGKEVTFDFTRGQYYVDESDQAVLRARCRDLDLEYNSDVITEEMIRNVTCISDFYIDIEDIGVNSDETCELRPVCIEELSFYDAEADTSIDIDLPAIDNAYLENWK